MLIYTIYISMCMDQVIKTLENMCKQRGYELITKTNSIHTYLNNSETVTIFFLLDDIFNTKKIVYYISYMEQNNINHSIILYNSNITSKVKEIISKYIKKIEIFHIDELKYNITEHILVPKHVPLNKQESKEFIKKYGVKFPLMLITDPVSKFFGLEKGDVVKIVRNNGVVHYRIVR